MSKKSDGMNIVDLVSSLGQIVSEGDAAERYDEKRGELTYQLTGKGVENAKMLVKKDVGACLFLFSLMWNEGSKRCRSDEEKFRLLAEIGAMFRDEFKINVLRVLGANTDKWKGGIAFKRQLNEDDEEFLKTFDPFVKRASSKVLV